MAFAYDRDPDSPWSSTMMLLIVLMLIGAGLSWLHFGLGLWKSALDAQNPIGDDRKVHLEIGGQQFAIAQNTIRFPPASARREVVSARADLVLHWPSLSGYREDLSAAFKNTTPSAPLIHVSLVDQDDTASEDALYRRIYRPYLEAAGWAGPAGLRGYRLAPNSGYGGEVLYQTGSANGARVPNFFIRCNESGNGDAPATCFRRLRLSKRVMLEYRYRIGLLAQWGAIDNAVAGFAAALPVDAR